MKKVFCFVVIILFASLPVFAQSEEEEVAFSGLPNEAQVEHFADAVRKVVPLHDDVYHLTVTKVIALNKEKQFINIQIVLDSNQIFERENMTMLRFFDSRPEWNLEDLFANDYNLFLYVSNDRQMSNHIGMGAVAFNFERGDYERLQAIKSIQSFVNATSAVLPRPMGEGERYVSIHFDEDKRLVNKVWEYDEGVWPEVRQYVLDNYEPIRTRLIEGMMLDTTNTLAWDAERAEVVVRHMYVNSLHNDSIEMLIAPWMWEKVREQFFASMYEPAAEEEVANYAKSLQQQCPYAIDTNTTLVGCVFDSSKKVLVHLYEVRELAMLSLENNANAQSAMRSSIQRVIVSGGFRPLTEKLVAARLSLEFDYHTRTSKHGFSFLFPPEELEQLLNNADKQN